MKKSKMFDIYQKILMICGLAFNFLSSIFLVACYVTARPVYLREELYVYIFNENLSTYFSIFFFLQIPCVVWFLIRLITYKKRSKEYYESLLI